MNESSKSPWLLADEYLGRLRGEVRRRLIELDLSWEGYLAIYCENGAVKACVGMAQIAPAELWKRLGMDQPLVRLFLLLGGEAPTWLRLQANRWVPADEEPNRLLERAADETPELTPRFAERLVKAIHLGGRDHLARDRAKGEAEQLPRMFAEAGLYPFELLQNAVDVGAGHVQVRLEAEGLVFEHDGGGLRPADVYGLSCIGRSGKAAGTIGFMGLGFKTVFKRFSRVHVADHLWGFHFAPIDGVASPHWQMLPQWDGQTLGSESKWTRFLLGWHGESAASDDERTRRKEVEQDLAGLRAEVPILIFQRLPSCRQAWKLTWDSRTFLVQAEGQRRPKSTSEVLLSEESLTGQGPERPAMRRRWVLLRGDPWKPTEAAAAADYRTIRGEDPDPDQEWRLTLFFEVKGNGHEALQPENGGKIFAVLPTHERLPMRAHLQADWLLAADRKHLQHPADSAWNRGLFSTLPELLVRLLHWIAKLTDTAAIRSAYDLLPTFDKSGDERVLAWELDGKPFAIPMKEVVVAVQLSNLVPVLVEEEAVLTSNETNPTVQIIRLAEKAVQGDKRQLGFLPAGKALWLPEPLATGLSPAFLRQWVGCNAFAVNALGLAGKKNSFWHSLGEPKPPTNDDLQRSQKRLQDLLMDPSQSAEAGSWGAVYFLAAWSAALKDADWARRAEGIGVLPAEGGSLSAAKLDRVAPGYFKEEQAVRGILKRQFDKRSGRLSWAFQENLAKTPPPAAGERASRAWQEAKEWIEKNTTEVAISDLVRGFFTDLQRETRDRTLTPEEVNDVLCLTCWAARGGKPRQGLIPLVLVDRSPDETFLGSPGSVYLSSDYGEEDLQQAAGELVGYVSPRYTEFDCEGKVNWREFFQALATPVLNRIPLSDASALCGCAYTPSEVKAWLGKEQDPRSCSETRNLPYGLGTRRIEYGLLAERQPRDPWLRIPAVIASTQNENAVAARERALAFARMLGRFHRDGQPEHQICFWWKFSHRVRRTDYVDPKESPAVTWAGWLKALRDSAWVPRLGGGIARPGDLYFTEAERDAEGRGDDPVVDPAVRELLAPFKEGLDFGCNLLRRPSELMPESPSGLSAEEMIRTWGKVLKRLEEFERRAPVDADEERKRLRELSKNRALFPHGQIWVTLGRVVLEGPDLGGWLLTLKTSSPFKELAAALGPCLDIPQQAGARQALDYLAAVEWEAPPALRRGVLEAYTILANQGASTPTMPAEVASLKGDGKIRLYCRPPQETERWLSIDGRDGFFPAYNNYPLLASCLTPDHGYALDLTVDDIRDEDDRKRLIKLLGLSCLRDPDYFSLTQNPRRILEADRGEGERFARILAAMKYRAQQHSGSLSARLDLIAKRTLQRCSEIELTITAKKPKTVETRRDMHASWTESELLYSGKPEEYARQLRGVFYTLLGEEGGAGWLVGLLELFSDLEDPERFQRHFDEQLTLLKIPASGIYPGAAPQAPASTSQDAGETTARGKPADQAEAGRQAATATTQDAATSGAGGEEMHEDELENSPSDGRDDNHLPQQLPGEAISADGNEHSKAGKAENSQGSGNEKPRRRRRHKRTRPDSPATPADRTTPFDTAADAQLLAQAKEQRLSGFEGSNNLQAGQSSSTRQQRADAVAAAERMEINWNVETIHKLYIPYPPEQFGVCHFLGGRHRVRDGSWRKYVEYYLRSAQRYDLFQNEVPEQDRYGLSLTKELKLECQIEKDEKFWLAGALLRCFYEGDRRQNFAALLGLCTHAEPPSPFRSWADCMAADDPEKIYLFFEAPLPSPSRYKKWLQTHLPDVQIVPYVLYAGHDPDTRQVASDLEGTTKVDALLINASNGFSVLFEAKVLSDISGQVTYDGTRNQIARNIDAMLFRPRRMQPPRSQRRPSRSCFILLSPELFRPPCRARLYSLLLPEYEKNPGALRRDIPSRPTAKELPDDVATRIDWLTWEAIHEAIRDREGRGICPWLTRFKYGPLA